MSDHADPWASAIASVGVLSETISLALHAFSLDTADKSISATTRKRLCAKAVQALKDGTGVSKELLRAMQDLHEVSTTWQRNITYASKSQQELVEQLEQLNGELHEVSEQLQQSHAQRDQLQAHAQQLGGELDAAREQAAVLEQQLQHRQQQLDEALRSAEQTHEHYIGLPARFEALQQAVHDAEQRVQQAHLEAQAAASEAAHAAEDVARHKEAVAQLTADNVLYMMEWQRAAGEMAALRRERDELQLAVEQRKGPWFEQLRSGVEERVRGALSRAEQLERQLESERQQQQRERAQQAARQLELQQALEQAQQLGADLQQQLQAAQASEARVLEQEAAARELHMQSCAEVQALQARVEVLHGEQRSMRVECNERWASEQAAMGQLEALRLRADTAEAAVQALRAQLSQAQEAAAAQQRINRHLMQRKEQVEWQLMAVLAKDGSTEHAPLALQVAGMVQVSRGTAAVSQAEAGGAAAASRRPTAAGAAASHVGDEVVQLINDLNPRPDQQQPAASAQQSAGEPSTQHGPSQAQAQAQGPALAELPLSDDEDIGSADPGAGLTAAGGPAPPLAAEVTPRPSSHEALVPRQHPIPGSADAGAAHWVQAATAVRPVTAIVGSGLDMDTIFSITSGHESSSSTAGAAVSRHLAEVSSLHPALLGWVPPQQRQQQPASSSTVEQQLQELVTPIPGSPRGARMSAAEVVITPAPTDQQ